MSKEEKVERLNQYILWLECFRIDVGSRLPEVDIGGCHNDVSSMDTETDMLRMRNSIENEINKKVCERYRLERDIEYDRVNSPVENNNE